MASLRTTPFDRLSGLVSFFKQQYSEIIISITGTHHEGLIALGSHYIYIYISINKFYLSIKYLSYVLLYNKTITFLIKWYFVRIFWTDTRISYVLEISLKCFQYTIIDPYFDKNATKIEDKFIWSILVGNRRSKPVSTPRTRFVRNSRTLMYVCVEKRTNDH